MILNFFLLKFSLENSVQNLSSEKDANTNLATMPLTKLLPMDTLCVQKNQNTITSLPLDTTIPTLSSLQKTQIFATRKVSNVEINAESPVVSYVQVTLHLKTEFVYNL